MKKRKPEVAIIMGSDSDFPVLKDGVKLLQEYEVAYEVRVMSAHRTPDATAEYAREAAQRGIQVFIAAAGGAAHLAGVIAAHTTLPVLGVPVKGGALNGIDALLATVQMPAGIPVATLTLGSAGSINAALFAIEILALQRPDLSRKLAEHKKAMARKVAEGNARVQAELAKGDADA
jgi:5-(carboxyamino)imidazole ribonucleotide mutase